MASIVLKRGRLSSMGEKHINGTGGNNETGRLDECSFRERIQSELWKDVLSEIHSERAFTLFYSRLTELLNDSRNGQGVISNRLVKLKP